MSSNLESSNQPNTLFKSASNSKISDNDGVSDEEDYENETFEEDTHDDEDDTDEELSLSTLERLRDAHRAKMFTNKTFTSSQIREIERQNAILMNKILTYNRKPSQPKHATMSNKYRVTSSAINRKKTQKKIDWENQILLRKIQTVKPSVKY